MNADQTTKSTRQWSQSSWRHVELCWTETYGFLIKKWIRVKKRYESAKYTHTYVVWDMMQDRSQTTCFRILALFCLRVVMWFAREICPESSYLHTWYPDDSLVSEVVEQLWRSQSIASWSAPRGLMVRSSSLALITGRSMCCRVSMSNGFFHLIFPSMVNYILSQTTR